MNRSWEGCKGRRQKKTPAGRGNIPHPARISVFGSRSKDKGQDRMWTNMLCSIAHPELCHEARDLPQSTVLFPSRSRSGSSSYIRPSSLHHGRPPLGVVRWFVIASIFASSSAPIYPPPFVIIVFHPLVASPPSSSIRPSPSFPRPSAIVASAPESIHLPPTSIPRPSLLGSMLLERRR
ncbi:hypothetical protein BDN70DRAFT_881498 [Pholiota conissans]|uniref:Uncharacterized protein n=1 Tax=Pholiota conissans TaxID=109636 RepID=A0A9P6CY47_9AGAR|nr:hypothetical protein BDN70DRAFT_881498 [Pholiota conissans]